MRVLRVLIKVLLVAGILQGIMSIAALFMEPGKGATLRAVAALAFCTLCAMLLGMESMRLAFEDTLRERPVPLAEWKVLRRSVLKRAGRNCLASIGVVSTMSLVVAPLVTLPARFVLAVVCSCPLSLLTGAYSQWGDTRSALQRIVEASKTSVDE